MLAEGSKMSLVGVAIAARNARSSGKGAKVGLGRCTRRSVPSASVACGPEHHGGRLLVYNSPIATL